MRFIGRFFFEEIPQCIGNILFNSDYHIHIRLTAAIILCVSTLHTMVIGFVFMIMGSFLGKVWPCFGGLLLLFVPPVYFFVSCVKAKRKDRDIRTYG